MGWITYALAWLAATLLWTLAGAASGGSPPLEVLPYSLIYMGTGALMGIAVWRMTARLPWHRGRTRFLLAHAAAMAVYSAAFALSGLCPELWSGRFLAALRDLRHSAVLPWVLLIGASLYVIVAGVSYAIRAQRHAKLEASAAEEARRLAQQAQLATLRAQLNPHFLFNALHSVGALVATDPARADQALESLGDLLRYTLGTDQAVFFSEEWKFTHDYLAFEHLRLGDRLRVDAGADSEAMSATVPPLVLQPLVENAVRHGIGDRPEGGRIDIRASVEDDRLVLRLKDDGRGRPSQAGEGIGLSSVRRRLEVMYGARAGVETAVLPEGFSVTVTLPLDTTRATRSIA